MRTAESPIQPAELVTLTMRELDRLIVTLARAAQATSDVKYNRPAVRSRPLPCFVPVNITDQTRLT